MSKFLISVLGLNRLEFTKRCLDAVFANSTDFDLVLTNNASTDGTGEYFAQLAKDHPNVTVFQETENTGFIPPNNRAFDMAKERGAPYFIALNNDTVPPPNWLELLAEPLDRDPNAALSGPSGGCCSLHNNMHGHVSHRFEYVEGACLCAKVSIVSAIGPTLFSDYLFMIYGDDSDLSLRVQEKGYSIHRVKFTMPHSRGETVQKQPAVKAACEAAQARNHGVLTRRWKHYLKVRRHDYPIVIKRGFALGDVILTTPIIRAIRKSNPRSQIHVETDFPHVFDYNPNVHGASRRIRPDSTAMVIDLGLAYERRTETHIVDAYADVARQHLLALGPVERKTEMFFSPRDKVKAQQLIPKDRPKVCALHVTNTTWPGKNWPEDRWGHVVNWLEAHGWGIVLVGAGHRPPSVRFGADLINKTTLHQLAAVIQSCQLFIGPCSGPLHVAQAVGTPVIGIFGITSSKYILTDGSPATGIDADPSIPGAGDRHRHPNLNFVKGGERAIGSIIPERVYDAVVMTGI